MPPQKLSESDKQDILSLYRATEETTSSLANRYGVSNTTISRILKQSLSGEEYEALIQQKRTGVKAHPVAPPAKAPFESAVEAQFAARSVEDEAVEAAIEAEFVDQAAPEPAAAQLQRQRRRSTLDIAGAEIEPATELATELLIPVEPSTDTSATDAPPTETPLPLLDLSAAMASQNLEVQEQSSVEVHPLEAMIEGDLLSAEEDFADEDDDDDLDDLEDDEDDDEEGDGDLTAVQVQSKAFIQVLPLSEALIPKTCYLVVDRASELITRPLRDFAELGQIPTEEIQAKTLPIFDNHRVARRFSRRMQRVVKVPDGRVLQKVGAYLQAKGITRLLIDGQVYSI
jgi:transposase-like protein